MEVLSAHLKNIRVPCAQDNVYKDECVYSYDTPVRGFVHFVCKWIEVSVEDFYYSNNEPN